MAKYTVAVCDDEKEDLSFIVRKITEYDTHQLFEIKTYTDAKLLLPLSLTELHILKEYGTSDQLETCMALKLLVDRCQISNPYAAINARVAIERLSPKQYLRFFAYLESLKV